MRILLLSSAFVLAALPAAASSIENISGTADYANSITTITCATCTIEKKVVVSSYVVPKLTSGVVNVDIRDYKGVRDVVRIDKFLGGSPVRIISKDQVPLMEEMRAANQKIAEDRIAAAKARYDTIDQRVAAIQPPDNRGNSRNFGIDQETTAAVGAKAHVANDVSTATPTEVSAPFDPAKLELRIN